MTGDKAPSLLELPPFVHRNLGVHVTYALALPDLAPGVLRDPDNAGDDAEI
ncbi:MULTISPECIES: hypothetical protein [unclassified Streptomyces]|uniref:hypothetical protein n=1 Tax=unclassified Streptomyces TaxID=2593676 RepID=UPI00131B0D84|nr:MULTISPECIES: hypothetical protein [unclassified Streptomyces]